MNILKLTFSGSVVALLLFVAASSTMAVDIVTRRSDNVALRGEITKTDKTSVTLKRTNGQEEVIAVSNLKTVKYEGEPASLGPARSNEGSGQFDTALERLKEAKSSYTGSRKEIKAEIDYLVARVSGKQALTDPAKIDAALDALEKFRSANKTSFRYLEATLLQAALHGAKKDAEKGKILLTEVQASPVKGFQLQAGVELGRLLLAAGDAAGALAAFEGVVSKSKDDKSAMGAMYDGMLGRAVCLKQQKKFDDALTTLDEIIHNAATGETRILAEAWIRKGDCLRQQNNAKAALMAYLHVDVLYPGEPAQHAEALLRLSELWGPGGQEDRAVDAASRLAELYPNSRWAKQASSGG